MLRDNLRKKQGLCELRSADSGAVGERNDYEADQRKRGAANCSPNDPAAALQGNARLRGGDSGAHARTHTHTHTHLQTRTRARTRVALYAASTSLTRASPPAELCASLMRHSDYREPIK